MHSPAPALFKNGNQGIGDTLADIILRTHIEWKTGDQTRRVYRQTGRHAKQYIKTERQKNKQTDGRQGEIQRERRSDSQAVSRETDGQPDSQTARQTEIASTPIRSKQKL